MKEKMKAAVYKGEGKLVLKEVEIPKIFNLNDVIVKVTSCGICGTDRHIMRGDFQAVKNVILGHEITGVVEKIGDGVNSLKVGDIVVLDPHEYCGNCFYCRTGRKNLCENVVDYGLNKDGGFAEYFKASESAFYKISPEVSPDIAAFTEVIADVIGGTSKVRVQPWESVAILGGGSIGGAYMRVFKISGASKIIMSVKHNYCARIYKKNGADLIVNPFEEDLEGIIKKETGDGVDIVVDTVGGLFDQAIKIAKKGGKLILFGLRQYNGNIKQINIIEKELQVYGLYITSFCFPYAIKLIESGVLRLDNLITHSFPLEKIKTAFKLIEEGKALKVMINP
jgi:threonine dehydrogenase-like Zn-dependent dehydrogenase